MSYLRTIIFQWSGHKKTFCMQQGNMTARNNNMNATVAEIQDSDTTQGNVSTIKSIEPPRIPELNSTWIFSIRIFVLTNWFVLLPKWRLPPNSSIKYDTISSHLELCNDTVVLGNGELSPLDSDTEIYDVMVIMFPIDMNSQYKRVLIDSFMWRFISSIILPFLLLPLCVHSTIYVGI